MLVHQLQCSVSVPGRMLTSMPAVAAKANSKPVAAPHRKRYGSPFMAGPPRGWSRAAAAPRYDDTGEPEIGQTGRKRKPESALRGRRGGGGDKLIIFNDLQDIMFDTGAVMPRIAPLLIENAIGQQTPPMRQQRLTRAARPTLRIERGART